MKKHLKFYEKNGSSYNQQNNNLILFNLCFITICFYKCNKTKYL
jgi:hypothetical protein